ncbi:hypothetical protein [Dyadobacter sp. LHD-138]|uniref:hypothetical protein n=1 Tax=Dyadobacter sp. LHD-138 TaxID=3071413 RepID=UPI0027E19D02|nr:hypothetical protein [Dyadobacter sp. LHD-138]MDQ6477968.1 hypothetical protein [Dyadobacter sp. LHD-138]
MAIAFIILSIGLIWYYAKEPGSDKLNWYRVANGVLLSPLLPLFSLLFSKKDSKKPTPTEGL